MRHTDEKGTNVTHQELSPKPTRRTAAGLFATVAICASFLAFAPAPALAARGHACESSFGEPGSGEGQLSAPGGVAVNEATGRVYVADEANNRVEYFSAAGGYEGQFNGSGLISGEGKTAPTGQFSGPQSIAVDNSTSSSDPSKGDVYVVDEGHSVVDKFTASGEYVAQLTFPEDKIAGSISVAVDPAGQLWVISPSRNHVAAHPVARFNDEVTNGFIEEFEEPGNDFLSLGLSVDSQDNLYVGLGIVGSHIEEASSSGKTLDREVGGESAHPGWSAVESSTGDVYLDQANRVSRYTPEDVLLERLGVGRLQAAAGVAVSSASGTVYIADSSADVVQVCPLEAPGKATILEESAGDVASASAVLSGEVNPRGVATEYRFEYGRCATVAACPGSSYETTVVGGSLAAGFEVSPVSVHPQDLSPSTVYHFRLIASNNQFGEVVGQEQVFTTQSVGGPLVLPDGRAWELVSPENANSAELGPISETGLLQASATGGAFSYVASYPVGTGVQGYGGGGSVQILSSREPGGGWSSEDLSLSHSVPAGAYAGYGGEYRFFSEDMSSAIAEGIGAFSKPESEGVSEAFPEPTERTPYLRHDMTCVQVPATCYEPVLTGAPGESDVSSLKKFGGSGETGLGEAVFVGATPDANDVLLSSRVQLTKEPLAPHGGLYEWSASAPTTERLQYVSLLPKSEGGVAAAGAEFGRRQMARHAISEDGSRVFFTVRGGSGEEPLYMRDTVRGETIRLDVPESGAAGVSSGATFEDASADGADVFFIDWGQLTADAIGGGPNLYECEIVEVEEAGGKHLKCDLSDLTPLPSSGQPGAGEAPEVLGNVLGVSEEDGGYVYFAANGVQAAGASPGSCREEIHDSTGQYCNLYVRHDGITSFIATLSGDDAPDWGVATAPSSLGRLTARVSPNGVWLAFMSDRSLTGYDNRDAKSGKPDEEVYLYNAETRRLVCASCNPTGSRPAGVLNTDGVNTALVLGDRVWKEGQWLAANIPGWTPYQLDEALYQSRYLSNSGRLFFNSSDALVSQDINSNEDVYEYEPEGAGSESAQCGPGASGVYKPARAVEVEGREVQEGAGCVGLISSGLAFGQSAFLDASADGSDVFFLTSEKLVPQDIGTGVSVYDAHECTASSPCASMPAAAPAECTSAASCRAAPMSQPAIFGAPSSATFSGAGNVTAESSSRPAGRTAVKKTVRCGKGKRLSHGRCVKVVHKHVKRARKASHGRGAKR